MSNKYEYGGRIGDETFNVGNLRKGNTSGDSLRTMLGSNKIRISTQQPKWALNNGPIRKQRNLGLQAKYAKLGGRLYQGGGSAKVNNIAKKQLPEFEPQHDDRYYDMYGPEAHNPKYPYTPQYGESYREGQELKIDGKNRTIVKNGDQLGYVDDKGLFHRLNISQTWKDTPQGGNYTGRYEWDDEKPKQTKPTQKVPVKKPPVKKPEPRPAPQPIQKLPQKPGSISIGNPKDDGKPGQVPTLKIEKEAPFDGYQEDKTFWDKFKKYFPGFGGGRGGGSGAGGRWKNGGSIRKYQVAGTTNSNNLNNMLKTRGNAAFNPLTNKPYTTTFDLNPQISYGNPKGWGQVYGNADIQRTPVFDQKRFGVGYNKKNLGSADMYYQNTNDDKSFGANANFNRGGYYAVGNAQIGKSSKDIGFQGGYKDDIFDVGANYNYTKGATVPGIHQLGVSAGIGDRLDISGNVTKSKIPGFNFTDIQGKYTGPKGGYVQGGFYQGDNGKGGQVIGGFKNDKGSIEGNIDYGNNINNAAVRGNYNNTVPVGNKGNKLSIGVKGSVNVNRKAGGRLYQAAGKTQLNTMPVDTGYTAPAIPNTNYYAPAESTGLNIKTKPILKKSQPVINQGTITQGYNTYYPKTHRERVMANINTADKGAKYAANAIHVTENTTAQGVNLAVNGKFDKNRILDPNLAKGVTYYTGIENTKFAKEHPEIVPAINGMLDVSNISPKGIVKGVVHAPTIGKALLHGAEHMAEKGMVHKVTDPIHGPATAHSYATKTKINPYYDESRDYKQRYNQAYDEWKRYKDAQLHEYPKGKYYINYQLVTPQEYNNAKKYVGVKDYKQVMPK